MLNIWVNFFLRNERPIPLNLAVNKIAIGYDLKGLEPASRLFFDFGAGKLTNSGYAISGKIFVVMILQVCLSCFMVRLDLENWNNFGFFKLLSFVMTLVSAISLTLLSTMTLMQEGTSFYLSIPLNPNLVFSYFLFSCNL